MIVFNDLGDYILISVIIIFLGGGGFLIKFYNL